jgi:mannosyltransferase
LRSSPPRFAARIGAGSSHAFAFAVAAVTALAVPVVLHRIGAEPLSRDEVWSMSIADASTAHAFRVVWNREANMTLYYLSLHAWLQLGDGAVFARVLSAVFAVASVPLLALLARRAFGPQAAIVAAVALVVNPYFIRYGQEARAYSLTLLLAVASSYLLVRAVESRRDRDWWLYTLTAVALVYAHMLASLLVVVHVATLGLLPRGAVDWRRVRRCAVAFALGCAPLALFIVLRDKGQSDWIAALSLRRIASFAGDVTGSYALVVLYAALFGAAVLHTLRLWRHSGRSRELWVFGFAVAWVALPPLLLIAASVVKPLFVSRYLIVAVPGLALLAGAVLTTFRPRWIAGAAAGALLLAAIVNLATNSLPDPRRDSPRAAAELVLDRARPGDGVAYAPSWSRVSVGYFLERLPAPAGRPEDVDVAPGGRPPSRGTCWPGRQAPSCSPVAWSATGGCGWSRPTRPTGTPRPSPCWRSRHGCSRACSCRAGPGGSASSRCGSTNGDGEPGNAYYAAMARLIRMDTTGHSTLAEWTAGDTEAIERAVAEFRRELDAGYYALVTEGEGHARQVTELPVDAELVILRRPIAGG